CGRGSETGQGDRGAEPDGRAAAPQGLPARAGWEKWVRHLQDVPGWEGRVTRRKPNSACLGRVDDVSKRRVGVGPSDPPALAEPAEVGEAQVEVAQASLPG